MGQAQPGPGCAPAHEGLEQMIADLGRGPKPRVTHRDDQLLAPAPRGDDDGRARRRRLEGIENEVVERASSQPLVHSSATCRDRASSMCAARQDSRKGARRTGTLRIVSRSLTLSRRRTRVSSRATFPVIVASA